MAKIRIPALLQGLTGNQDEIESPAETIRELMEYLIKEFPELKKKLYDEKGTLRKFINVYVNDEDIGFLQGEDTPLKNQDIVFIIIAIAGG
jgi:molybdopterin synthase sulfur carrier subunit